MTKFKVGDKVVPHHKSIGMLFTHSLTGKAILNGDVDYLHVVEITDFGELGLSAFNNQEGVGYYLPSDVKLYEEPIEVVDPHNLPSGTIRPDKPVVEKKIVLGETSSRKFKVGDAVVPVAKSIGTIWEECSVIKEFENGNEPYLYINHVYGDGDISLDTRPNSNERNFFRPTDVYFYNGQMNAGVYPVDKDQLIEDLREENQKLKEALHSKTNEEPVTDEEKAVKYIKSVLCDGILHYDKYETTPTFIVSSDEREIVLLVKGKHSDGLYATLQVRPVNHTVNFNVDIAKALMLASALGDNYMETTLKTYYNYNLIFLKK